MPILLTGASGLLSGYLLREIVQAGEEVCAWSSSRSGRDGLLALEPVDLVDPDRVRAAFRKARPEIVIHTAAVASVAECHRDAERARQVNTLGTALLAELAATAGVRMVYVSTDLVFHGEKGNYREDDEAKPLSIYGRTKRDAEQAVLAFPEHLVVRASLLFGPTVNSRRGFFDQQLEALRADSPITLFADEWRTPLSLATAAHALVALAQSDCTGIIHLGGPERMSRLDMGLRLAAHLGLDASGIVRATRDSMPSAEPRPRDVSLDSSRWRGLFPDLDWAGYEESLQAMAVG